MSNDLNLPWYVFPLSRNHASVMNNNGLPIIDKIDSEKAAQIVRAINNHDALVSALEWVIAQVDDDGQFPGHAHEIPGIWDDDNSHADAGKPCVECIVWSAIKALVAAARGDKT